jgi:Lipase (class 3)
VTINSSVYALLLQDSYERRYKQQEVSIDGVRFVVIDEVNNPVTGCQAVAYQQIDSHEIVIAYRGTEFGREPFRDGLTDGGMVLPGYNVQVADAMAFTNRVLTESKIAAEDKGHPLNVTVTGHSLGGTLAEITAYRFGLRGETFNAYGAAGLLHGIPEGGNQVIDHVRATDVVSAASTHFGEVHVYAAEQDVDRLFKAGYHNDGSLLHLSNPMKASDLDAHGIDNFIPQSKILGQSILSPENEARYRAHQPMIDMYRNEVRLDRTLVSGQWAIAKEATDVAGTIGHEAADKMASVYAVLHQQAAGKISQDVQAVDGVVHQATESASRTYDAARDKVVQGMDATQHVAGQASQAIDAASKSVNEKMDAWFPPGAWSGDKPTPLNHPDHRDNPMYQQARDGVHQIDAQHQRTPDRHSDQLAAALVVAARHEGMSQIHQVVLSDDGSRTFAAQGERNMPFRQIAQVDTVEALNTPIEQSSVAWQNVMQQTQREQAQQHVQQQEHQQAAQHARSAMSM